MAVIDEPKDQPIGGINIPLYEVAPGKPTRVKKLLNEPEKVSFISHHFYLHAALVVIHSSVPR